MNAFDYFFEKTLGLEKSFLVGKEEISYKQLHDSSLALAYWLEKEIGRNKHIILMSTPLIVFFQRQYLMKSIIVQYLIMEIILPKKILIIVREIDKIDEKQTYCAN